MLLSDDRVREFLRTRVVPVWESVRPVPKVSIDFGDGRVLNRTLKGNTVVWLCDPRGNVVDAYPGVYVPQAFLSEIEKGLAFMRSGDPSSVGAWHRSLLGERIEAERRTTMGKAYVETPLLNALGLTANGKRLGRPVAAGAENLSLSLTAESSQATYQNLIAGIVDMSEAPMAPETVRASLGSPGKPAPTPEKVERRVAQMDSNQSVRLLRPAMHLLLSMQTHPFRPSDLRDRVFKEILKVDIGDPYLGLGELAIPGTPKVRG